MAWIWLTNNEVNIKIISLQMSQIMSNIFVIGNWGSGKADAWHLLNRYLANDNDHSLMFIGLQVVGFEGFFRDNRWRYLTNSLMTYL